MGGTILSLGLSPSLGVYTAGLTLPLAHALVGLVGLVDALLEITESDRMGFPSNLSLPVRLCRSVALVEEPATLGLRLGVPGVEGLLRRDSYSLYASPPNDSENVPSFSRGD